MSGRSAEVVETLHRRNIDVSCVQETRSGVSNIRPAGQNPACQAFPSAKPTRPTDTVQREKYSELVARLIDDFQQRFEDFRKHTDIMKLLSDLFQVDPTGAAVNNNNNNRISIAPYGRNFRGANVKYQMEFADIQNDSDLKRAFSEQGLLSLDSGYVSSDSYPQSVTGCQELHCSVW